MTDALIDELLEAADNLADIAPIERVRLSNAALSVIRTMHAEVAPVDFYGRPAPLPNIGSRLESLARFPASHSARETSVRLYEAVQTIRTLEQELNHSQEHKR